MRCRYDQQISCPSQTSGGCTTCPYEKSLNKAFEVVELPNQIIPGWQRCPVCEGKGVNPHAALSSDTFPPCPTCQGERIISILTGKPPVRAIKIVTTEKANLLQSKMRDHFFSHDTIQEEGVYVKLEDVYAAMDEWLKIHTQP